MTAEPTITQREAEIINVADSVSRQAHLVGQMVHAHVAAWIVVEAVDQLVEDVDTLHRWTKEPTS